LPKSINQAQIDRSGARCLIFFHCCPRAKHQIRVTATKIDEINI
jgi:hypothetical protein